jgi:hypothetical protein
MKEESTLLKHQQWIVENLPRVLAKRDLARNVAALACGTLKIQIYNTPHVSGLAREIGLEVLTTAIRMPNMHDMLCATLYPIANPEMFKELIARLDAGCKMSEEDVEKSRWFLVGRDLRKFCLAVTTVCKLATALDTLEDAGEVDFSGDLRQHHLRFVDIGLVEDKPTPGCKLFYAMFAFDRGTKALLGAFLTAHPFLRAFLAFLDPEDPFFQGAQQFPADHRCPNCKRELYTRITGPAAPVPYDESETCDTCYDTEVEEGELAHPRMYRGIEWNKIPQAVSELAQYVL